MKGFNYDFCVWWKQEKDKEKVFNSEKWKPLWAGDEMEITIHYHTFC